MKGGFRDGLKRPVMIWEVCTDDLYDQLLMYIYCSSCAKRAQKEINVDDEVGDLTTPGKVWQIPAKSDKSLVASKVHTCVQRQQFKNKEHSQINNSSSVRGSCYPAPVQPQCMEPRRNRFTDP